MVRRQFRRAFKLKAVRQVKRPWGFGDLARKIHHVPLPAVSSLPRAA